MEIFEATLFLALLAGTLSIVLVLAARRFAVKENPLTAAIDEILPQYNCGACGYPGCAGFAQYLAESRDPDAICIPGGPDLQKRIAKMLGVMVKETFPMSAHVFCRGTSKDASSAGEYLGLQDCVAADLVLGATKVCPSGCLGMGSCLRACGFDAVTIQEGIATIDEDACVACGKCVEACPRDIIRMVPKGQKVCVECHTPEKGGPVKKYCIVGCITCNLCVKKCPEEAIELRNGRIVIDHQKCTLCGTCVEVCPQHTICGVPEPLPAPAAASQGGDV